LIGAAAVPADDAPADDAPADDVPADDAPAVDVALVDAGLLLEEQAPATTTTANATTPDKSRRFGTILAILSGFVRYGRWI
jgi:hypothetical protein